jgi:tetratricopeptide (TPR) repeat protein
VATGNPPLPYTSRLLAAWRGREAEASRLIDADVRDANARGEGRAVGLAEYARAVLYNGLGRYEDALAAAQRACEHDDLGYFAWALVELVEAAARSGARDVADAALSRLEERTRAAGTDWALGIEARSCALLSDDDEADDLYREAIERLGRSRIVVHAARAHLLYGRVAAPREPPRGRPRAAAHRPRAAQPHRGRGVRRARPPRTARSARRSSTARTTPPSSCSRRRGATSRATTRASRLSGTRATTSSCSPAR